MNDQLDLFDARPRVVSNPNSDDEKQVDSSRIMAMRLKKMSEELKTITRNKAIINERHDNQV